MSDFEVMVKTPVKVTHLLAKIGVRYWEDGYINGEQDSDDAPKMPLKSGDTWVLKIDLATGHIEGWPENTTASTHYKVCDDGVYSLLSADGSVVAKNYGYVPDMLYPEDDGYGDYVILNIDGKGKISGWRVDLSYFESDE